MKCVYLIRCVINNKCYVGQTTNYNHRVNSHRCDLRKNRGLQKIQEDWNKYGEDCFEFIVLEQGFTKEELNDLEKKYIEKYDTITNGYNTSKGGIGQGNFGYLNGMYGKQHTEKSKRLMSKNRKGLAAGEKNGNYGNHDNSKFTKEVRKKMSEKAKLRWARKRKDVDITKQWYGIPYNLEETQ